MLASPYKIIILHIEQTRKVRQDLEGKCYSIRGDNLTGVMLNKMLSGQCITTPIYYVDFSQSVVYKLAAQNLY